MHDGQNFKKKLNDYRIVECEVRSAEITKFANELLRYAPRGFPKSEN
jgi:hypothetical protein